MMENFNKRDTVAWHFREAARHLHEAAVLAKLTACDPAQHERANRIGALSDYVSMLAVYEDGLDGIGRKRR